MALLLNSCVPPGPYLETCAGQCRPINRQHDDVSASGDRKRLERRNEWDVLERPRSGIRWPADLNLALSHYGFALVVFNSRAVLCKDFDLEHEFPVGQVPRHR